MSSRWPLILMTRGGSKWAFLGKKDSRVLQCFSMPSRGPFIEHSRKSLATSIEWMRLPCGLLSSDRKASGTDACATLRC